MKLSTEVSLGPSHIVLDGDPAPPPQRGTAPNFRPMLWPDGWLDQDATLYLGKPWPRQHCVRWEGTDLNFRPMSVVAKRMDGSRCHWYGGRPQTRPHCVRWGPSPPKTGGLFS